MVISGQQITGANIYANSVLYASSNHMIQYTFKLIHIHTCTHIFSKQTDFSYQLVLRKCYDTMLFLMSTDHTSTLFCLINLAFLFYLFCFNPWEDLQVGSIAGQVTAGLNVQVTSLAGSCPGQVFDAGWSFWILQHERQKGGKIIINTLTQVMIRVLKDEKKSWITTSYGEFIITLFGGSWRSEQTPVLGWNTNYNILFLVFSKNKTIPCNSKS